MIAQIDTRNHTARHFDIRKLTPRESLRLMGVTEDYIDRMMQTEERTYRAISGCEQQLELLGLEDNATPRDIREAAEEAIRQLNDNNDDENEQDDCEGEAGLDDTGHQKHAHGDKDADKSDSVRRQCTQEDTERPTAGSEGIFAQRSEPDDRGEVGRQSDADAPPGVLDPNAAWNSWHHDAEEIAQARDALLAAPRVEKTAEVQVISNSALYKLAGNSIVADVLMYIYEEALYATGRRLRGEVAGLFDLPQFQLRRDWQREPFRLISLCSGYDSQAIALDMLQRRHPDFRWVLTAWSEFDPESSRPIDQQPAVVAHRLLFPDAGPNLGDMTQIDWTRFMHQYAVAEGDIDLLTYSTPCQSISQAGKREGIARGSGTRSSVLWSTEDAVAALRPKILLQENVRALVNRQNIGHFREWRSVLERQGYTNFLPPQWTTPEGEKTVACVLNSRNYGVPQNRDRVYMISIRKDIIGHTDSATGAYVADAQYEFPRPFALTRSIADVLEEDVSPKFFLKPESVEAFLEKNEQQGDSYIYRTTDRKLTQTQVDAIISKMAWEK